MKNIIAVLFFTLFLSACYYDNIGELHPEAGLTPDCDPDTTSVTYTKDIKPLLLNNCGSDNNGCHNAGNTTSLVSLSTYDDVSAVVSTGQLIGSITHDPNYKPMPNAGDKLSDCKINKVKAWINQGLIQ